MQFTERNIAKQDRGNIPILNVATRERTFLETERELTASRPSPRQTDVSIAGECAWWPCPYQCPQFGSELNPKMQKCTLCVEECEQGKKPICVRSCTMRALDVGPLSELKKKYEHNKKDEGFTYYQENKPSVIFKPKVYHRIRSDF